MRSSYVVQTSASSDLVAFVDMEDGQIGQIAGSEATMGISMYDGRIVIRKFDCIFDLSPEGAYWRLENKPSFKVRLLPPGSKVTLIVQ